MSLYHTLQNAKLLYKAFRAFLSNYLWVSSLCLITTTRIRVGFNFYKGKNGMLLIHLIVMFIQMYLYVRTYFVISQYMTGISPRFVPEDPNLFINAAGTFFNLYTLFVWPWEVDFPGNIFYIYSYLVVFIGIAHCTYTDRLHKNGQPIEPKDKNTLFPKLLRGGRYPGTPWLFAWYVYRDQSSGLRSRSTRTLTKKKTGPVFILWFAEAAIFLLLGVSLLKWTESLRMLGLYLILTAISTALLTERIREYCAAKGGSSTIL